MLNSLQICRAVAALLVVLHHAIHHLALAAWFGPGALQPLQALPPLGQPGVILFFVLSGFIILHAHQGDVGQPQRLRHFLLRRVIRIYPTFMLVFALVWLLAMAVPDARARLPTDPAVLIQALLLIPQDPQVVGHMGAPVLIVAWTLHVELLFYAAFACLVLDRRLFILLLLLYLLQLAVAEPGVQRSFVHRFLTSDLLLLFLMGMGAQLAVQRLRPAVPVSAAAAALAVVGLACAVFGPVLLPAQLAAPSNHLLGGLCALLLFGLVGADPGFRPSGAAAPAVGARSGLTRLLLQLGAASYAIYLLHAPLIWVITRAAAVALPQSPWAVAAALLLLVGLSAWTGWVFHRRVEAPVVDHLRRRTAPAGWSAA